MQGPKSSVSTLPETINFDRSSSSGDTGIDSQMSWNSIPTSVQNRLPEYRASSSGPTIQYLQHLRPNGPNAEWSYGEASSSSSHHQGDQNERKKEHPWPFQPQFTLPLEEGQCRQSGIISLDNDDEIPIGDQTTNGSFALCSSTSTNNALTQDLNMISEFNDQEEDDDDDECQVIERPTSFVSIGPSNEQRRSIGSFSDSFRVNEREDGPGLDGRRMSCKRKAFEGPTGQSSGVGSPTLFQNNERSQWTIMPSVQMPTENEINNSSEQANPRPRLGVGGSVSASPFSLSSSGNGESSSGNFRLRINGLYHQDPIPENPFPTEANIGNVEPSSSRFSSRLIRNHLFDLNPSPPMENRILHGHGHSLPHIRRHHQSRWSGASSTRSSRSPPSAMPEERNPTPTPFGEPASRSISEHPMFVTSQNPTNWNLPGGSNSVAGIGGPISRAAPSTGPNSSEPSWTHRSQAQHPRRQSEIVRRSLLSSAGAESRGESSNHGVRSALSQEIVPPSGSESHGHRLMSSRSALLGRHVDGSFGIPYSMRTLGAGGEGRGSMMSEIRHVLDLMRRGEGLRVEDLMILDHSVLFGMADIHDRHRDMRLDVDNMSYEELLALEERIGNVCTGLSEEIITNRLKRKKFTDSRAFDTVETEPCSICREEYNIGEDLGTLECGHDFHRDCIKQWLVQKNLCPICKSTGLTT